MSPSGTFDGPSLANANEASGALAPEEIAARIAAPPPVVALDGGATVASRVLAWTVSLVVAAAGAWWTSGTGVPHTTLPTSVSDTPDEARAGWPAHTSGEWFTSPVDPDPPALLEALHRATSYLTFAQALHTPARRGDAQAQLMLSEVLDECAWLHAAAGGPIATSSTLEEVLRQAMHETSGAARIQARLEPRCRDLTTAEATRFGPSQGWLFRAARSGIPVALAAAALAGWTNDDPPPQGLDQDRATLAPETLVMLTNALRSREGMVFWILSEHPVLLSTVPGSTGIDALAWKLLACSRGLDCTAPVWQVHRGCREPAECRGDESAADWIRRRAAKDLARIQGRALVLARHVDLEQWPILGLPAP